MAREPDMQSWENWGVGWYEVLLQKRNIKPGGPLALGMLGNTCSFFGEEIS